MFFMQEVSMEDEQEIDIIQLWGALKNAGFLL